GFGIAGSIGQTSNANSGNIMAEGEIDNLTMEKYLAFTRGNQALGVVKPKIARNLCYAFSRSHSLEPLKGGWTDYRQEPSIPGISLKRPLSKGIVHHPRPLSSLKKSITSSRREMKHYTKPRKGTMACFTNAQHTTSIAIRR
ncbi:hypothetical protein Tco_1198006, partial [Tanacetum coccineum]